MKPRRTVPRKATKPPSERQTRGNRARRQEALEQQERARRRPLFPCPEDEERYRP